MNLPREIRLALRARREAEKRRDTRAMKAAIERLRKLQHELLRREQFEKEMEKAA